MVTALVLSLLALTSTALPVCAAIKNLFTASIFQKPKRKGGFNQLSQPSKLFSPAQRKTFLGMTKRGLEARNR